MGRARGSREARDRPRNRPRNGPRNGLVPIGGATAPVLDPARGRASPRAGAPRPAAPVGTAGRGGPRPGTPVSLAGISAREPGRPGRRLRQDRAARRCARSIGVRLRRVWDLTRDHAAAIPSRGRSVPGPRLDGQRDGVAEPRRGGGLACAGPNGSARSPVASVADQDVPDVLETHAVLEPFVDAIELNASCPNVAWGRDRDNEAHLAEPAARARLSAGTAAVRQAAAVPHRGRTRCGARARRDRS